MFVSKLKKETSQSKKKMITAAKCDCRIIDTSIWYIVSLFQIDDSNSWCSLYIVQIDYLYKTKYSRMDQVKFLEDSLQKIWSDMVCRGRPYHCSFFKGFLPQILLGPFLNTLSKILRVHLCYAKKTCRKEEFCSMFVLASRLRLQQSRL